MNWLLFVEKVISFSKKTGAVLILLNVVLQRVGLIPLFRTTETKASSEGPLSVLVQSWEPEINQCRWR